MATPKRVVKVSKKVSSVAATKLPANLVQVLDFVNNGCKVERRPLHADIATIANNYDQYAHFVSHVLYSRNKAGKYLSWHIIIGLFSHDVTLADVAERSTTAHAYYYTISGQIDGKQTTSSPTAVTVGKGEGKSNFMTPLTQALLDARGEYNLKLRKGYSLDKEALMDRTQPITIDELMTRPGMAPWRVRPTDLNKFQDHRHKFDHLLEEADGYLDIQPKLDGTLTIAVKLPKLSAATEAAQVPNNSIDLYSRDRDPKLSQPHINAHLAKLLKNYPGVYVIGELWREGYSLQELSGMSRKLESADVIPLYFNVFDCFRTDEPLLPRCDRLALLCEIFGQTTGGDDNQIVDSIMDPICSDEPYAIDADQDDDVDLAYAGGSDSKLERLRSIKLPPEVNQPQHCPPSNALLSTLLTVATDTEVREHPIRLMPTFYVKSMTVATQLYKLFLRLGLEGAILRDPTARHEYSFDKPARTMTILKWKPYLDNEWPIVGYKEGVGKEAGVIIWIGAQNDLFSPDVRDKPLADRQTFAVTMNETTDVRRHQFAAMTPEIFKRDFYGKLMKIKYSTLGKDSGLPQQPKALMFWDEDVQAKLAKMSH